MRRDNLAAAAVGLILGALGHAAWVGVREPAAPAARGEPAATKNSSVSHGQVPDTTLTRQAPPASAPARAAAPAPASAPPPAPAAPAAAAAAAATADEAIAAFKALAKEGMGAFGRHGPLVEKFRALDADGIAILAEMLRDMHSSGTRFLAAAVLEALKDPRTVPALDAALGDPDVLVSRMASHGLAVLESKDAVPALERGLNEHQDWGVQVNSAYGLAKIGEKSGNDFLIQQFRENPMAKFILAGAMADVGSAEFSAELRPMIGDAKLDVGLRLAAAMCAEKARDRDALPLLEATIASPEAPDSVKDAAKKAVNAIRGEKIYAVD